MFKTSNCLIVYEVYNLICPHWQRDDKTFVLFFHSIYIFFLIKIRNIYSKHMIQHKRYKYSITRKTKQLKNTKDTNTEQTNKHRKQNQTTQNTNLQDHHEESRNTSINKCPDTKWLEDQKYNINILQKFFSKRILTLKKEA